MSAEHTINYLYAIERGHSSAVDCELYLYNTFTRKDMCKHKWVEIDTDHCEHCQRKKTFVDREIRIISCTVCDGWMGALEGAKITLTRPLTIGWSLTCKSCLKLKKERDTMKELERLRALEKKVKKLI